MIPPKTLVIGKMGCLGSAFFEGYIRYYPDTIGTSREGPYCFDLVSKTNQLNFRQFRREGYTHAVIAAGMSKLSLCEQEKKLTYKCNVDGTLSLAKELHEAGLIPILFSSDNVFDGKRGNYTEEDPLSPINEYGRQKSQIEKEIAIVCEGHYLLIRLSKVIDFKQNNLLDEMAYYLLRGESFNAAIDQVFTPIWIDDLVLSVFFLQTRQLVGIFNLCGIESLSRYTIACQVARVLNVSIENIIPILLEDLKEDFRRPQNVSLSNEKVKRVFNYSYRSIADCIKQIGVKYNSHMKLV